MNDIAGKYAHGPERTTGAGRPLLAIIAAIALGLSWLAIAPPTARAAELTPATLYGPTNRTASTISVRFDRVVESAGTCQADIGYEFNDGSGWVDELSVRPVARLSVMIGLFGPCAAALIVTPLLTLLSMRISSIPGPGDYGIGWLFAFAMGILATVVAAAGWRRTVPTEAG